MGGLSWAKPMKMWMWTFEDDLKITGSCFVCCSCSYTEIYAKCFVGRIDKLARSRSTNFAVQKLVTYCKEKSVVSFFYKICYNINKHICFQFEAIFEELDSSFKQILDSGHSGVILAVGEACKRLIAKQGPFIQVSISKSFV